MNWRGKPLPMAGPADWLTRIAGRIDPGDSGLQLEMPLGPSNTGGSGSFQARCSDGRRWWVKPLNNCQGSPRVVVNEFIVGRLGLLIGAPVCEVDVVRIGPDHVGWEFRAGHQLEEGLASGSRDVEGAHEAHQLDHRNQDDNQRRHVGAFALYDWCWGADPQWLFEAPAQERTHSHDHGYYFPDGPNWTGASLQREVSNSHALPQDPSGLLPAEKERVADRLGTLTADEIGAVLRQVPSSWPVTDEELADLGVFLEQRAPLVGERVRVL